MSPQATEGQVIPHSLHHQLVHGLQIAAAVHQQGTLQRVAVDKEIAAEAAGGAEDATK